MSGLIKNQQIISLENVVFFIVFHCLTLFNLNITFSYQSWVGLGSLYSQLVFTLQF